MLSPTPASTWSDKYKQKQNKIIIIVLLFVYLVYDATLLGSPIGDIGFITVAIDAKTAMLKCLRESLHYLTCHDAYLLLRHSLAIYT